MVGKHLYAVCQDCLKVVRLTGFFARWHLCLTPEELAMKHRADANLHYPSPLHPPTRCPK